MSDKNAQSPPRLAMLLLNLFIRDGNILYFLGDLEESYARIRNEKGRIYAFFWFWYQTLIPLPDFFITNVLWNFVMLKNYLKVSIRNILKEKLYTFINIFSLALGLACCVLIALYVYDEINFDKCHEKSDKIYGIYAFLDFGRGYAETSPSTSIAPAVKKQFPDIIHAARIKEQNILFKKNDLLFNEHGLAVDETIFDIFTINLVKGDNSKLFARPNSVVLDVSTADKYFGQENPVGESISIRLGNSYSDYTVTGVVADPPPNSSLQFSYLLNIRDVMGGDLDSKQAGKSASTFLLLSETARELDLEEKFSGTINKELTENFGPESSYKLYPYSKYHLAAEKGSPVLSNQSDIMYSYILSAIGILILLLACFNYTNLSASMSLSRLKEIGVRKVFGAGKEEIIRQFMFESVMLSFIAIIVGVLAALFFLPSFNIFAQKQLSANLIVTPAFLLTLIALNILTGILAGGYPALLLSRTSSVQVFQKRLKSVSKGSLSKILVTAQFSISIFFIAGTLFMMQQQDFMLEKDLGYDSSNVIVVDMKAVAGEVASRSNVVTLFRENVTQHPYITHVSGAHYPLTEFWMAKYDDLKEGGKALVNYNYVDYDYVKTLGLKLVDGRDFSIELDGNNQESVIVNEAYARELNVENPVGKRICEPFVHDFPGTIIGVVKDFHTETLKNNIRPSYIACTPESEYNIHAENNFSVLYVKFEEGANQQTLKTLKDTFENLFPDTPFIHYYLQDNISRQYLSEKQWAGIVRTASAIAIVIACLGLLGLCYFTVVRKTREIGIRKTLGATGPGIVLLFYREFIVWILLANFVSWPVVYFAVNTWLENFAYRINIGISTFVSAGALSLVTALITVTIQSVKAVRANPVDSLKYE